MDFQGDGELTKRSFFIKICSIYKLYDTAYKKGCKDILLIKNMYKIELFDILVNKKYDLLKNYLESFDKNNINENIISKDENDEIIIYMGDALLNSECYEESTLFYKLINNNKNKVLKYFEIINSLLKKNKIEETIKYFNDINIDDGHAYIFIAAASEKHPIIMNKYLNKALDYFKKNNNYDLINSLEKTIKAREELQGEICVFFLNGRSTPMSVTMSLKNEFQFDEDIKLLNNSIISSHKFYFGIQNISDYSNQEDIYYNINILIMGENKYYSIKKKLENNKYNVIIIIPFLSIITLEEKIRSTIIGFDNLNEYKEYIKKGAMDYMSNFLNKEMREN